jgi:transposase InsO family protein
LVLDKRKLLPRLGGRKIHYLITDQLNQSNIVFGRDKLFKLMRENDLLIKPRRRYIQTTNSKHWLKKYPNIAKTLTLSQPEQLWVSDITYLKTEEGNCFLGMVTDAYSRKIMGYAIDGNMEATTIAKALSMAIKNRKTNHALIHHSDRGLQYCSKEYVNIAEDNNIRMSMTENSDPYENALAERMNRTIKEEFCLDKTLPTKALTIAAVKEAIELYNSYRPHLSLGFLTPDQQHQLTTLENGNFELSDKAEASSAEEQLARNSLTDGNDKAVEQTSTALHQESFLS